MKKQYSLIALGLALCVSSAFAAKPAGGAMDAASGAAPMGKQQSKMGRCSKDAKEKSLKGDERKKFMSSCLKAKAKA